jgi:Fe-S-cluster-containing hydrogenase component 2
MRIGINSNQFLDELKKSTGFPSEKRMKVGAVAVIECVQEIPCDVCGYICPNEAIEINSIKDLPKLIEEKCIGCGLCIPFCPGLAIFQIDTTFSESEVLISFPYEFIPLPKVGSTIEATDRLGKTITNGRVIKVTLNSEFDKTAIITISVPKKFYNVVRGIKILKEKGAS